MRYQKYEVGEFETIPSRCGKYEYRTYRQYEDKCPAVVREELITQMKDDG